MLHEEFARIHIAELIAEAEAERLARTAVEAGSTGTSTRARHQSTRLIAVTIVILLAALRLIAA